MLRLGWRFSRANDFASTDRRPLHDTFGDLQKFMTWPHFEAEIDFQSVTSTFLAKTITATDDPYNLIRASSNIQVPTDFDTWMFFGYIQAQLTATATPGRHVAGFLVNAAVAPDLITERDVNHTGNRRIDLFCMAPVTKLDTLTVAMQSPATINVDNGVTRGYFLPRV